MKWFKEGTSIGWRRCHDAQALRKGRGLRTYNLKFDRLAFKLNSTNLKVDANRRDVTFCVGIVCKTEEEAGLKERISMWIGFAGRELWYFSNARVTDEKELEEVVVLAGVHVKEGGRVKKKKKT